MTEESKLPAGNESSAEEDASDVPEYDLQMLRHLEADLRHAHTETLQTFTDLSGAAGRLLGFTGTTLAVIVGAAALVEDVSTVITVWNASGFGLVLGSALLTIVGLRSRQVTTGFHRQELERALAIKPAEGENTERPDVRYVSSGQVPLEEHDYLVWAARSYTRWIDHALAENASKSRELYYSRIMYAIGLILLIVGTFLPVYLHG